MVAVNLWYHVGPANEDAGPHRVRAPVRAHDVPGLEARAAGRALPHARGRRRERLERHDRFRSHQLLRDACRRTSSSSRCGSSRTAWDTCSRRSTRPALSNQQDVVRNERRQSVENQPYGIAEEAVVQTLFPKGHPYYGNVIGSHEDIQAAKLDDVQRFFRQYYAPNNASLAIVGDFEPAADEGAGREVLRHAEAGTSRARRSRSRRRRSPRSGARSCRRAWSCRACTWRGSRRRSSSQATPTRTSPRHILGGGRSSRLYKKLVYEKQIAQNVSALAVVADARLDVPDRGDRASGPHGRGAREGDRRGAGDAARRSRRQPRRSSGRATPSRPNIVGGLEQRRAASPTG